MQFISSFNELIALYDGFLIDLWGVVHDGSALYGGVAGSFKALRACNKRVVMLSNAPRRVSRSVQSLQALGISRNAYDAMITSGEVTFEYVATHYSGKKFYFMGEEEDSDILIGIAATRIGTLAEADFVLNIGHYYAFQPLHELHDELQEMAQRMLPMLCANPDREIVKMDGTIYPCAGEIAEYYESIGGTVTFIGKPYRAVYDRAIAALNLPADARILAIGDNPLTDIRGGNAYGLDTLLILSGVLHAKMHDKNSLEQHLKTSGDVPTWYCASFGIYSASTYF